MYKLAKLQGEILLSEKQLQKLQVDLEQHNQIKGKALKQFDEQIRDKKKELETLNLEGFRVQTLLHLIQKRQADAEKDYSTELELQNRLLTEAEEKVKFVYITLDKKERLLNNKDEALLDRERQVKLREEQIDIESKNIASKTAILTDLKRDVLQLEEAAYNKVEQSEKAIAKAQLLLDDIESKINEKTKVVKSLNTMIDTRTKQAECIGIEATEKLKRAEFLILSQSKKEESLNEKTKELNKKELWLSDREKTMARAYNEIIQRGGTVNGA